MIFIKAPTALVGVLMSMHGRDDIARRRFLASLMQDLVSAGFAVVHDSSFGDPKIAKPGVSEQLKNLYRLRAMQIVDAREFIRRMERQGILSLFGDADTIDISAISPEIHFCASQRDHEIFNYARLFQHVPTANRVGRQIRAVIYDVGQRTPKLMGIIGLASSAYTLGCRDNYLGWRGSKNKAIKDAGLRQTLDLAVVLAAPPYSFLHCGKLMASLALSEPVRHEVTRRYKSDLLGVVTTSATGLHCPIFNRIALRPGGLYRRIGETAGYTTLFASRATLKAARAFLPDFESSPQGTFSISVRPLRVLRDALQRCGIASEPVLRSGIRKGVYFGAASAEHVAALRRGKPIGASACLSVDAATTYWREQVLSKALEDCAKIEQLAHYRPQGPLRSIHHLAA